jgi:ABC-type phosphate transport system substrate-binding protein
MRILSKLVVVGAAAATAAATAITLAAPSALADPPRGVVPKYFDVVGTGSNTIEYVWDQFSVNYNAEHKTHNASNPWIYSWDASPTTAKFVPKQGCAAITRTSVNGSSAGIAALAAGTKGSHGAFCEDFARSSRARKSTDPKLGPGGVAFVTFARDAITYASRDTKGGTNVPKNLSTADLTKIYSCTVRNWNKFPGGKNGTILPVLPQSSSGTRATFLADINVTTPGSCVFSTSTLEENQGQTAVFNSPNVIVPFSIGKWLTQEYRSAPCANAGCTACKKPKNGQNLFGCAVNGFLGLNFLNGTAPTTGKGSKQVINPRFTSHFFRFLYNVVRYTAGTPTKIPAYLERFFNPASARIKGWICTNAQARAEIVKYGFLNTPFCGSIS